MTTLAQSREILLAARQEAATIRAQALADGRSAAAEEAAALMVKTHHECQALIERSSDELVDLALSVSERFVRELMQEHSQLLTERIKQALQTFQFSSSCVVVTHSDDHAELSEALAEGSPHAANISLKTDPSMPRGTARIESDGSTISICHHAFFKALRTAREAHLSGNEQ